MSRKKINKPESPFKVRVENDGIYISALKQDNAQLTQLNYDLLVQRSVESNRLDNLEWTAVFECITHDQRSVYRLKDLHR